MLCHKLDTGKVKPYPKLQNDNFHRGFVIITDGVRGRHTLSYSDRTKRSKVELVTRTFVKSIRRLEIFAGRLPNALCFIFLYVFDYVFVLFSETLKEKR